jgi:hypothetical protein
VEEGKENIVIDRHLMSPEDRLERAALRKDVA